MKDLRINCQVVVNKIVSHVKEAFAVEGGTGDTGCLYGSHKCIDDVGPCDMGSNPLRSVPVFLYKLKDLLESFLSNIGIKRSAEWMAVRSVQGYKCPGSVGIGAEELKNNLNTHAPSDQDGGLNPFVV